MNRQSPDNPKKDTNKDRHNNSNKDSKMNRDHSEKKKIAIIGLGYVGLPLAVEFGKHQPTLGFDISQMRVTELQNGKDRTMEVDETQLTKASYLSFTANEENLKNYDIFIITVPTPVTESKVPDLRPIQKATQCVAKYLKPGAIVIYESTVYPGCTEEFCVPLLEAGSRLKYNQDFFCGYSPERINPGDKEHSLTKIVKVTSGSNPEIAKVVDELYASIITAGTYPAPNIKTAEAAKVIENTQRDINIAFVNELSLIFEPMGLNTNEVLDAASTKWNFLPFRPGLVGGHCIGVDPYYLTHKAEAMGFHPQMILAGRRINDNMGKVVASRIIKQMIKKDMRVQGAKVLLLGVTFKENCPDVRNTRSFDIARELEDFGCSVTVSDPWADPEEVYHEYNFQLANYEQVLKESRDFQAVVVAVAHTKFFKLIADQHISLENQVIFDVKNLYKNCPHARECDNLLCL